MRAYYNEGDNGETIREDDIPADMMDQAEEYRRSSSTLRRCSPTT